ncbi:putative ABC transporter substrate-binding protein [Paenibacillus sp. 598K]|uniref:hypothetical protein n=1 Tax=Paenibacillus sp. 598K TaxID=1117987 RepID=UPI000FFAC4F9|nr:hypothetical protein [Paenibacillus sp. 598K]GBF72553.1 putative ABC transporter substrate-binding protein [Paenibacillus sp. 598K]
MKKRWKWLSSALALSVIATSLVACSGGNNTKKEEEQPLPTNTSDKAETKEDPLVVNMLLIGDTILPKENNPMHQWLLEHKNIDLRFSLANGEVSDQMNMLLAGGELPDVVRYVTNELSNSIANKWADAGLSIRTDELLAKYPNLLKYSDSDYNAAVFANKKDGSMNVIPSNPASHPDVAQKILGFFVKEDWLKQVGMEAPKTTDELFEVLMAFKEQIANVDGKPIIPMSLDHMGRQNFMYTWTKNWYDLSEDHKTLYWWFNHPNIEEYMVFMNKLYVNGLLDREFLTQQPDQYQAKLSSGRVGITFQTHVPMDTANGVLKASDPNSRYVPNPPIRQEGLPLPIYASTSYGMFEGIVISKKFAANERNLERFMEFLDWNATNEGSFFLSHGVDSEYYVKNADGLYEPKPEVKAELDKGDAVFEASEGLKFYNLLKYPVLPSMEVKAGTEEFIMGETIWAEGYTVDDNLFNPAGTGPEWDKHWGNLWPEIDKWQAKAIFAKDEAEARKVTQEMLAHFEKIGAPEVTEEKLRLIEEYLNK